MGFFPTDAVNDQEVGPNANGSYFKYVAADNKWILIPNADVYTEAEVDAFKLNKWVAPDGPIAMNSKKFTGLTAGTGAGDSVRFEQLHAEGHVLATTGPHTGTLPWTDLNKTGSSLAHLATRTHASLSDAPTDAHHVRYANSEAVQAVEDAGLVMENPIDMKTNLLTVGDSADTSDPITLIEFETERAWYFRKRSTGASTNLRLECDTSGENFGIGYTNLPIITFNTNVVDASQTINALSHKILNLANGSGAQDAMAFGQKYTNANAVTAVETDGLDFATTKTLGFVDDEAGVFIDRIYDENNMTSDDEHGLATQQSIKAHVAAEIAGAGAFNPPIGFITMYSGSWTDNTTIPGWYKCDGNNGTVNLVDKFVRGGATSGASGGSDNAVVVSHTHGIKAYPDGTQSYKIKKFNTHGSGYTTVNTNSAGVSGVGANKPAYYTLIFIQRIS